MLFDMKTFVKEPITFYLQGTPLPGALFNQELAQYRSLLQGTLYRLDSLSKCLTNSFHWCWRSHCQQCLKQNKKGEDADAVSFHSFSSRLKAGIHAVCQAEGCTQKSVIRILKALKHKMPIDSIPSNVATSGRLSLLNLLRRADSIWRGKKNLDQ